MRARRQSPAQGPAAVPERQLSVMAGRRHGEVRWVAGQPGEAATARVAHGALRGEGPAGASTAADTTLGRVVCGSLHRPGRRRRSRCGHRRRRQRPAHRRRHPARHAREIAAGRALSRPPAAACRALVSARPAAAAAHARRRRGRGPRARRHARRRRSPAGSESDRERSDPDRDLSAVLDRRRHGAQCGESLLRRQAEQARL